MRLGLNRGNPLDVPYPDPSTYQLTERDVSLLELELASGCIVEVPFWWNCWMRGH